MATALDAEKAREGLNGTSVEGRRIEVIISCFFATSHLSS